MSNITQVVNEDMYMTTLKKIVVASGLDKVLSGAGPYTLFAPPDLAFEKLDKGTLDNLLKSENEAKLTDILNHHVVSRKINFKALKDGEKLKTLNGMELKVHVKDGHVTMGNPKIQSHDVQTSNGVIHALDTVITK